MEMSESEHGLSNMDKTRELAYTGGSLIGDDRLGLEEDRKSEVHDSSDGDLPALKLRDASESIDLNGRTTN